jgi:hypothetical protein
VTRDELLVLRAAELRRAKVLVDETWREYAEMSQYRKGAPCVRQMQAWHRALERFNLLRQQVVAIAETVEEIDG